MTCVGVYAHEHGLRKDTGCCFNIASALYCAHPRRLYIGS